jgi:hypothetical protein
VGQLGKSEKYRMERLRVVYFHIQSSERGSPPSVSIKDHVGWVLLQQALIMYRCIRDLWGPANLVASTVAELDDTPL